MTPMARLTSSPVNAWAVQSDRRVDVLRPRLLRTLLPAVLLAGVVFALLGSSRPAAAQEALEAGAQAVVSADGDCLNLRAGATVQAARVSCIADGTLVTAFGDQREADGYLWERVEVNGLRGWMAGVYLAPFADGTDQDDGADQGDGDGEETAPPPPEEPRALPVPPPGGFTSGLAGTSDVGAFVEAQPFEVATVWLFRPAEQDSLTYIPGAPAFVNTLDGSSLRPDSVVIARRQGERSGEAAEPPAATGEAPSGEPNVLPSPPSGKLTLGVSGTNDPVALALAQPFEVRSVYLLHVPSQQWLMYIPGAPDFVQSLARGQLQPDSVVWMLAGTVTTPTTVEATLSYYYCNQGSIAAGIGDGGGWCGGMANGAIVHEGAAACARDKLGQRFRIVGDPRDTTYTCTDTGSAVHGQHRDIWFDNSDDGYRWFAQVGRNGRIEILSE